MPSMHSRWVRYGTVGLFAAVALWRMTDGLLLRTPAPQSSPAAIVLGPLPDKVESTIGNGTLEEAFDALATLPTHAPSWLAMADRLRREGQRDAAQAARARAVELAPSSAYVLRKAARAQLRDGQYAQAMALWQRAWRPAAAKSVLRDLVRAMDRPRAFSPLLAAIDEPTLANAWAAEAARYPTRLRAAQAMLAEFEQRGWDTHGARAAIVAALAAARRWNEAYFTWFDGLPAAQRTGLAWVFDGGFDQPLGHTPFEWTLPNVVGVHWRREPAADAGMALRADFSGVRVTLAGAGQTLLLVPGDYRMAYRYRSESLQTTGKLGWVLGCIGNARQVLARGPQVPTGATDWTTAAVRFSVPRTPACPAQRLSLDLATELTADSRIAGTVWFDDFRIERVAGAEMAENP